MTRPRRDPVSAHRWADLHLGWVMDDVASIAKLAREFDHVSSDTLLSRMDAAARQLAEVAAGLDDLDPSHLRTTEIETPEPEEETDGS